MPLLNAACGCTSLSFTVRYLFVIIFLSDWVSICVIVCSYLALLTEDMLTGKLQCINMSVR